MDYAEYKELYKKLLSEKGRVDIGERREEEKEVAQKINEFLKLYPTLIPKDKDPATPVFDLSVKEIANRSISAAIDIIEDFSSLLEQRPYLGNETFRRRAFKVFTKPERRMFVGIWLIFFSFVLYFIDSAA